MPEVARTNLTREQMVNEIIKLHDEIDRLRALLKVIATECDPADPPWLNPEAGRKYIWERIRETDPSLLDS